jgi:hypothetical protein
MLGYQKLPWCFLFLSCWFVACGEHLLQNRCCQDERLRLFLLTAQIVLQGCPQAPQTVDLLSKLDFQYMFIFKQTTYLAVCVEYKSKLFFVTWKSTRDSKTVAS